MLARIWPGAAWCDKCAAVFTTSPIRSNRPDSISPSARSKVPAWIPECIRSGIRAGRKVVVAQLPNPQVNIDCSFCGTTTVILARPWIAEHSEGTVPLRSDNATAVLGHCAMPDLPQLAHEFGKGTPTPYLCPKRSTLRGQRKAPSIDDVRLLEGQRLRGSAYSSSLSRPAHSRTASTVPSWRQTGCRKASYTPVESRLPSALLIEIPEAQLSAH